MLCCAETQGPWVFATAAACCSLREACCYTAALAAAVAAAAAVFFSRGFPSHFKPQSTDSSSKSSSSNSSSSSPRPAAEAAAADGWGSDAATQASLSGAPSVSCCSPPQRLDCSKLKRVVHVHAVGAPGGPCCTRIGAPPLSSCMHQLLSQHPAQHSLTLILLCCCCCCCVAAAVLLLLCCC